MASDDLTRLRAMVEAMTPIEWAPGYRVSRDGSVVSERNWRGQPIRQMVPFTDHGGYAQVRLTVGGRSVKVSVHRLVAEAFCGPRTAEAQVRHLDGNKTNNAASNLAWGTAKENADDRERHGTTARGARHGARKILARGELTSSAKLSPKDVVRIRQLIRAGATVSRVAAEFGVSRTSARHAARGTTWAHIREGL